MIWVVQENLFREQGLVELLEVLERGGIEHKLVKIVPFVHELEPDVDVPEGSRVWCVGATSMAKVARRKRWEPGCYQVPGVEEWLCSPWSDHLLNRNAVTSRVDEVVAWPWFKDTKGRWSGDAFVRPCEDNKAFAGQLFGWHEFEEWRSGLLSVDEPIRPLQADTMVAVSRPEEIVYETRFFVVDGKIATFSEYKRGGRASFSNLIDAAAMRFAGYMIELWDPAPAYALDVCWTGDHHRIVEINSINSAGLYAADVSKLVQAVEAMP